MVPFKEYKQHDKVYLSVVENEDTKAELGTTIIVCPSLLHLEIEKIPILSRSDLASSLTTRVEDRMHDDIYLFHSASHDDSCIIITFPLLGRKIIFGEVCWGSALKIFGKFSFILE